MPRCPTCQTSLSTQRQREGLFYLCPTCHGRAVTFPQIRRVTGDAYITGLIRQLRRDSQPGRHPCPFCAQPMREFHSAHPPLELDGCFRCSAVWFDTHEFESVPPGASESEHTIRLRGIESMATHRLEELRRTASPAEGPPESWMWVPAVFGFPVESEAPLLRRLPLLTWGIAMSVLITSAVAFTDLKAAVGQFAFVPADPFRLGGLTFLTAFFLHAGPVHLVGNLYFLLIFGDNVEDFLGRWRYTLLLVGSTVMGSVVHLLFDPESTRPCIGASGGISGVIMFYALQYPQARLGLNIWFRMMPRWIEMPAWGAMTLWMGLQLLILVQQRMGTSNVAATAHLGGALAGFLAWILWRRFAWSPPEEPEPAG